MTLPETRGRLASPEPTPPVSSEPTTSHRSDSSGARVHGLDALRGGALLLGIVLHGLMPFLPGGAWLVVDRSEAVWPLFVIVPIHMFRMALFLMIAGYFGRRSLRKRGAGGYLTDRGKRVLLPLFAFWPIAVFPLGPLAQADAARRGRVLDMTAGPVALGQLWFLWVLAECVVIATAVALVGGRLLGGDRVDSGVAWAGRLLTGPAGVLFACLPHAAAMILQHRTGGIAEPFGFAPEPAGLVGYLGAFAVGWALSAVPDGLGRLARRPVLHLVAALPLTVGALALGDNPTGSGPVPLPVADLVWALGAWCWVYGLTGLAVRHLTRERGWVRYLADSSYWLYLLHLPLLVGLEFLVAPLDWPILAKIAVVWLPALGFMLLTYDLLVRPTWVGRWLNGRRYPSVLTRGRHAPQEP